MWASIFVLHLLQGIPEALPLNPIARWEWVFPVVEAVHICGFSLLVGTIVIASGPEARHVSFAVEAAPAEE